MAQSSHLAWGLAAVRERVGGLPRLRRRRRRRHGHPRPRPARRLAPGAAGLGAVAGARRARDPAARSTPARVVLAGHSRNGKAALIAAGFDDRFAGVVSSSSGVLGAIPARLCCDRHGGEGVELLTRHYPEWYHPRLRFFSGREHRLPTDAHELLALVAPRPLLLSVAVNDPVESTAAARATAAVVEDVYARLGAPGAPHARAGATAGTPRTPRRSRATSTGRRRRSAARPSARALGRLRRPRRPSSGWRGPAPSHRRRSGGRATRRRCAGRSGARSGRRAPRRPPRSTARTRSRRWARTAWGCGSSGVARRAACPWTSCAPDGRPGPSCCGARRCAARRAGGRATSRPCRCPCCSRARAGPSPAMTPPAPGRGSASRRARRRARRMVADAIEVLDALGVASAAVAGYGTGALVALHLAVLDPRVDAVAAIAPTTDERLLAAAPAYGLADLLAALAPRPALVLAPRWDPHAARGAVAAAARAPRAPSTSRSPTTTASAPGPARPSAPGWRS